VLYLVVTLKLCIRIKFAFVYNKMVLSLKMTVLINKHFGFIPVGRISDFIRLTSISSETLTHKLCFEKFSSSALSKSH
jgi:hypothetical protein